MPIDSAALPENILRLMSPADRAPLGAAGLTAAEAAAKALAGEEDKLQQQIANLLNLRGIEYITPSMRRKSALPPGWPDFTFVYRAVPFALEAKTAVGTLSPEQEALHPRLAANGWQVRVVRSVAEVKALLDGIPAPGFPL